MPASCSSAPLSAAIGSWSYALGFKPTHRDADLSYDPDWETWERLHREPCQELDEQGLILLKEHLNGALGILMRGDRTDTAMVAALHSKTSFVVALVRVLAVGTRQPFRPLSASGSECPHGWAVQGAATAEDQHQQQQQPPGQLWEHPCTRLTTEVLGLAAKVTVVLLQGGAQVAASIQDFGPHFKPSAAGLPCTAHLPLKSLRLVNTLAETGVLHSCSKQVAQMCSVLQQLLGQLKAGGGGGGGEAGGGSGGGGGCADEANRQLPPGLLADSITLITHASTLTHGMVMYACMTRSLLSDKQSALPAAQLELARAFMRSLAQQLVDTCIMEHLAKGLILLAACLDAQGGAEIQEQQQQQHGREGAGARPGTSSQQRALPWYVAKESWPPQHRLAQLALDMSDIWHTLSVLYSEHSDSKYHARQDVRSALSRALSGTCAQHLALSLGVMGLRAVDGGPVYGLPVSYNMLRPEPLWRVVKKVEPGVLLTVDGQLVLSLLDIVQADGRVKLLPVLGEAERLELLLRIGRAAVRSAAAHTGALPVEQGAGSAAVALQAPAPEHGPVPYVLPKYRLADVAARALLISRELLDGVQGGGGGGGTGEGGGGGGDGGSAGQAATVSAGEGPAAAGAAAVGAAVSEAVGAVPGRKRLTAAAARAMDARWWEFLVGAALHNMKLDPPSGPAAYLLGPLLTIPNLGPLTGGLLGLLFPVLHMMS